MTGHGKNMKLWKYMENAKMVLSVGQWQCKQKEELFSSVNTISQELHS